MTNSPNDMKRKRDQEGTALSRCLTFGLFCGAIGSLLATACPVHAGQVLAQKPNVIFILADDVGAYDLGCYGSAFHDTPNINSLAARGVRLTQAYTNNPSCSPTRSSILTGLHPARIGITDPSCHFPTVNFKKGLLPTSEEKVLPANGVTRLDTRYTTLAEVLRDSGYRTGHFGKWHLGAKPYSALEHGFESDWPNTAAAGPGGPTSYFSPWLYAPNVKQVPGEHIEDRMAQEAVAWMREHKDEPFFLNYWAFSVHGPWVGKPDYVNWFSKIADPNNPQRNPVHAAMLRSLDDAVGTLVRNLEELGIADRTVIVFYSDNGGTDFLDRDTMMQYGFSSPPTHNGPLRGGKGTIYEGGTRVPGIVVWPGVIKPGTTSGAMFQSMDFYPTLLEMLGAPAPAQPIDGISQVKALRDGVEVRDTVFCHWPHGGGNDINPGWAPSTSVRKGDFKLIRFFADNEDASDRLELYDLSSDPGETVNLVNQAPRITRRLNGLIDGFLRDTDAVLPKSNPNWRGFKDWQATQGTALTSNAGLATVTNEKGRPMLHLRNAPEKTGGKLTLKIQMRTLGPADRGILYWSTSTSAERSKNRKIEFPINKVPGWHVYSLDFTTRSQIKSLWLVSGIDAKEVRIDWIRLSRQNGPLVKAWEF